jgi:hypothetical protein
MVLITDSKFMTLILAQSQNEEKRKVIAKHSVQTYTTTVTLLPCFSEFEGFTVLLPEEY